MEVCQGHSLCENFSYVTINEKEHAQMQKNLFQFKSNRKAMNRNWSNQKANPALKTKAGNKRKVC